MRRDISKRQIHKGRLGSLLLAVTLALALLTLGACKNVSSDKLLAANVDPASKPAYALFFVNNFVPGSTSVNDPVISELIFFAGSFPPRYTQIADGQILQITSTTAPLYSLLGPAYGGDGLSTFALPDINSASYPNLKTFVDPAATGSAVRPLPLITTIGIFPNRDEENPTAIATMPIDPEDPYGAAPYIVTFGAGPDDLMGLQYFMGRIILVNPDHEAVQKARAAKKILPCDGSILEVKNYQALTSLLGTTYGGDARTSLALPDLRGLSPTDGRGYTLDRKNFAAKAASPIQGMEYYIVVQGIYPSAT